MSAEHTSRRYQWDDRSFVSETPLCDAFVARQYQERYMPKLRTRRTEDTWTAQTFNEALWLNGIIEDLKKNNAINIVRQWLDIFCRTWLDRDASFLDVIDDSTIEGFIRTHWALHTKSESERTLAERMMKHLYGLLDGPENFGSRASPSKKRHRGNGGPSYDDKASKQHPNADGFLLTQQDASLTTGTIVPLPGESSKKKKRRKHAGPSHIPDVQKQDPKVETVLPPSHSRPLGPGAVVIPPIEAPTRKKRGRKPKQAKPFHDPPPLQQPRQAEMVPDTSQHISPTVRPPSLFPSNPIGVDISLDDDASLGWTNPPRPIPVPAAGRYPRSSSHAQNEDDNIRTPPSTGATLDVPPKGRKVLTTPHESDEMAPRKITPFSTDQTLTRPRFAKRLDKVAPLKQTQNQPDDRPILAAEPQIWAEVRS
ncbi:hypothetical protein BS47DRAFT_84377 [Hydnum rufescens UP504]|uniref:Uncharacterized protein n=1 Tax=Hydnum rufescens UP504 TaxID=1448309 RepID=A0A9P6B830_9AGAM|nr:hypothetical protein BS47DRAFT_84377 [Hydnum rufescens UP504]